MKCSYENKKKIERMIKVNEYRIHKRYLKPISHQGNIDQDNIIRIKSDWNKENILESFVISLKRKSS